MKRALLICIALLLATPVATGAASEQEVPPNGFPGQRAATDPLMVREVDAARSFWRARNVAGCDAGVSTYVVENFAGDPSSAFGGNCAVYFLSDQIGVGYDGRMNCAIVFHEVGHALGLGHTRGGLMGERGPQTVPFECRKLVPKPRPRIVTRRTRNGISGRVTDG